MNNMESNRTRFMDQRNFFKSIGSRSLKSMDSNSYWFWNQKNDPAKL